MTTTQLFFRMPLIVWMSRYTCISSIPSNEIDNDGDGYGSVPLQHHGLESLAVEIAMILSEYLSKCLPIVRWYRQYLWTPLPSMKIDNDGDGYVERSVSFPWSGIVGGGDCDDTSANIYPNASHSVMYRQYLWGSSTI